LVAGVALAVAGAPFAAAACVAALSFLSVAAWTAGVGDVAFVELAAGAAVLVFDWRMAGEAAAVPAAGVMAVAGLYCLPTLARLPWAYAGYPAALRLVATVAVLVMGIYARSLPEVDAHLRPAPFMIAVLALVPAGAAAIYLLPIEAVLGYREAGVVVVDMAASLAGLGTGVLLLVRAARGGRAPFTETGAVTVALAAAWAVLAWCPPGRGGAWASLPSMFLLAAATVALALAATRLTVVVRQVVLHDVRGRRRWEAAERELARVRGTYQAQRHDINSMLSAIDGTLMVLTSQRLSMTGSEVDRLTNAVRNEVTSLRSMLAGPQAPATYDLSQLCITVTAVHAASGRIRATIADGLVVQGHPERIAAVLGNLLANSTAYAPGAPVDLVARHVGDLVEVEIADHGPGLAEGERAKAFDAHWRGSLSHLSPGSGLGLCQCRQLVEAEGGTIELLPTDKGAMPGQQGLTARVRVPVPVAHPGARARARLSARSGDEGRRPTRTGPPYKLRHDGPGCSTPGGTVEGEAQVRGALLLGRGQPDGGCRWPVPVEGPAVHDGVHGDGPALGQDGAFKSARHL
jgi:signal transduction histidine kinase